MSRFAITPALLGALLAAHASAQVVYVDANASTGGDGSSWTKAYSSLSTALGAAKRGNTLWVAAGTYRGGFTIPAGVALVGGFESGAARRSESDPIRRRTNLDGGGSMRVVEMGADTSLDGFFVVNGSPQSSDGGGGVLIKEGKSPIRNTIFFANESRGGRAAALHVIGKGDCILENVVVTKSKGFGHAIDVTTAKIHAKHLVVHDNVSNGFHVHSGSTASMFNCIFSNNSGRGVCHISSNDVMQVENNLFFGNSISLLHIRGRELRTLAEVNALAYAKNNVEGDPMFVDPANFDFRVKAGSPAIDAGIRMDVADQQDLYGGARLLDGTLTGTMLPDMGAAEFTNCSLEMIGVPTRGNSVQIVSRSSGAQAIVLFVAAQPLTTPVVIDPMGPLLIDPSPFLLNFLLPQSAGATLPIPANVPVGASVAIQALGIGTGGSNFSNRIDLRVR